MESWEHEKEEPNGVKLGGEFLISVDYRTRTKMDYISKECSDEVSGWLTGNIDGYKIGVDGLLIPKQTVSGAHTQICAESLVLLRKQYKDKCEKIVGHWHSHNTMGTFFSGNSGYGGDEKVMEDYSAHRQVSVFMVSSKGDIKARVIVNNSPYSFSVDDVGVETVMPQTKRIVSELKKELEQKVSKAQVTTYPALQTGPRILYPGRSDFQTKIVDDDLYYNRELGAVVISGISDKKLEAIMTKFPAGSYDVDYRAKDCSTVTVQVTGKKMAKNVIKHLRILFASCDEEESDDQLDKFYSNYYGKNTGFWGC